MTTSTSRAFVSIAAAIALTLSVSACVRAPSGPTPALIPSNGPLAIRFDNDGSYRLDVYLIGEKREWLLGRVEPGANARFAIPEGVFDEGSKFVRLAVLANAQPTLQAARDPRAKLTLALPLAAIVSERWSFSRGELTFAGR
jgi:hypothetical protein